VHQKLRRVMCPEGALHVAIRPYEATFHLYALLRFNKSVTSVQDCSSEWTSWRSTQGHENKEKAAETVTALDSDLHCRARVMVKPMPSLSLLCVAMTTW